jgi:hypothetical protein
MPRITTRFVYPTTPLSHLSWTAWLGDDDNHGQTVMGHGRTEAAVISDLVVNYLTGEGA